MEIDSDTNFISSFANKKSKLGATMHNAAYNELNSNFIYVPFAVEDIKTAINGLRAMNFKGSAVSMPHKQEVMKYLDEIDTTAKKIGAVNTIINQEGKLKGYNSDWVGAMDALKEITSLKGKKVVLIGAGGAARAIAYGLKENNCKVTIFNRTFEKAKNLANEFNLGYGENIRDIVNYDYDILINATSVGYNLDAGKSIVNKDSIKENKVIMDIVTNPIITPILEIAKEKNCKIISGYKMLIYQAMFQIELWTGKKPKFETMEEAILKFI
jgi:shikimate dehydrogenase